MCPQQTVESEQVMRELQESQVSLGGSLAQMKQQLTELHETSSVLDSDLLNLQETQDRVRSVNAAICNFPHIGSELQQRWKEQKKMSLTDQNLDALFTDKLKCESKMTWAVASQ